MRTFVVTEDTDLEALAPSLLVPRLSRARTAAALEQLREANPHADSSRLAAGTVLFVPDAPGVSRAAGTALDVDPRDELRGMTAAAFKLAAAGLEAGGAARAAAREEVRAALTSALVRRLAASDPELAVQVEEAGKALESDAAEEEQAAGTLEALRKGALEALTRLDGRPVVRSRARRR